MPPLALETKLRYVIDVCEGLAHAHERGIVHRDVKPANVLIDNGRARLADFGIARDTTRGTVTSVAGSPNYFAPDQLAGTADHRSDLFALGATMYELLTGTKAFPGSISDGLLYRILQAPSPALPPEFEGGGLSAVVARALEKDPDRRFQSAADFRQAVAGLLDATETIAGAPVLRGGNPIETQVVRFRRRLIEAVGSSEIRRLKYEVDQYLSQRPYDVDGRMLADDIDRTIGLPPGGAPPVRPPATTGLWKRLAPYTSILAVAAIVTSAMVLLRDGRNGPEPVDTPSDVARTAPGPLPSPDVGSTTVLPPLALTPSADVTAIRAWWIVTRRLSR